MMHGSTTIKFTGHILIKFGTVG